jgi:hypothetical protein
MRVNRWTVLVALLGMLLHAGLLARHNNVVLAAALQLDPAASIICSPSAPQGVPALPGSSKTAAKCPICLGAAPAVAALSADPPVIQAPGFSAPRLTVTAETAAPRPISPLPPSRAPPSHA